MIEYNEHIVDRIVEGSKKGLTLEKIVDKYLKDHPEIPTKNKAEVLKDFDAQTIYYPNYPVVRNILTKKFIRDIQTSEYYIYDENSKRTIDVDLSSVSTIFNSKDWVRVQDKRLKTVWLGYNPTKAVLFYTGKDGVEYINLYRPADWQFPYVYDGVKPPNTPLPERYDLLFKHLCSNEPISYNYLINFLAALTQPSESIPKTHLVMLSIPGTGKNTLTDIMSLVLGENNVYVIAPNNLKEIKFNAGFKNKKLIMFDEVKVKDAADENFLKEFVNTKIGIEEKGKDKRTYENFAGLILASNDMAAVRIATGDRRYSLLDLPSKPLTKFVEETYKDMDFFEYRQNYLIEPEAIKQLGEFLLNVKVDRKIIDNVLESKARNRHRTESLKDWENIVYEMLCPRYAGQEIDFIKATDEVRIMSNVNKLSIGRDKWKELSLKRPGFFTVKCKRMKNGEKLWVLDFEKLEKQPNEDA